MVLQDTKSFKGTQSIVAIGNFDGVHRGHQHVFHLAQERAGNLPIIALSFWPHPNIFFRPNSDPFLLGTMEERANLLSSLTNFLIALPFDKKLAGTSATHFIEKFLIQDLKATHIFVGANFRFGKDRLGDVKLLRSYSSFDTELIAPIRDSENEIISSTRIRNHLKEGRIQKANLLLGRPYRLNGKVIHGEGVGNGLGFPTANMSIDRYRLMPEPGIYATHVQIGKHVYNGATYIGSKPTFHEDDKISVETFLIDYDGNLYDHDIKLDFVQRIRSDKKFKSVEALISQIARDVEECKLVLERP